jgi:FOG: HPt domain
MANQGSSGLPVLDTSVLDELREVIGTETARIVGVFLDDTPGVIRQLQEASLHEDMGQLRELAHSLKSAAANVGAMALSATARRVELGARAGTLERPAVAVALVIAEFARARLALSGYQNAIRNEAGVDG